MKSINKFAFFIVVFLLVNTSIFLISSDNQDNKVLGDIYLWKYDVNGAMKWTFKKDELREIYKYPWDYLKKRLKMEGYKTDDASMKEYFSYVIDRSKELWNNAIDKLLGCGSFGGHKDTFIKNLNKVELDLVYAWNLNAFAQRDSQGNIMLSENRLFDLILYIADKLSKTEEGKEPNFDDLGEKMHLAITGIAHELMHALGELEGYFQGENEIYECIVACLEFLCFDFSNFPDYCEDDSNCKVLPQACKDKIKCKQNPPQGGGGGSGIPGIVKSYFLDTPDDHYSFSDSIGFSGDEMNSNPVDNFTGYTFNDMLCFNYYPGILIYNKYGDPSMGNLLNRIMPGNYIDDFTHDYFSNKHKILVIPSAALIGDSESEIIRQAILRYLENHGSVVLFTQQYGKDIKNIIPTDEGGIGPIVGFREDSSCLKNSVYLHEMHPILSSSTTGILDVGIDGYASVNSSSNATVLLRRIRNDEPGLLYWKYGAGTIYLYFGFTDYAYSRSMAGTQEIKLVKNMLRHALDPDANIPMFNLEENPNPTINLSIRVTNHSETPAAKAKISVYTIENTLVYETETPVNLNQGDYTDIPISFTLPDLAIKDYGIGYTVFELTDADGNPCQLKTETPSGRFSIYKLITPANINDRLYQWFTVDDEVVFWGDEIECTIHFKNRTDQVRQVEIKDPYFFIDHGWKQIPFNSFSATVNPGETYEHVAYLPTNEISLIGDDSVTFRIQYYDAAGQVRQLGAAKLVYVKKALTKSSVTMNKPYSLDPGGPVNYSINSFANASIAGETTIKLVLERYTRENMAYTEIQTLFQGTHDFSTGGDFQYNGSYTPAAIYPSGPYRLKLEVIAPNEIKELTRYQDFYYEQSGFKVTPGSVKPLRWLVPGETYTIPVYTSNVSSNNDYHVTDGRCILRLLSPAGLEIYRKEITNINIAAEAQLDLTQTFVFNPVETGDYSLEYAYEDETFNDNLRFRKAQVLYYWPSFSVTPDKSAYDYMDTANMMVKVNGLGNYTIQCQCPEAGVAETRGVQIIEPGIPATEVFQVPLGMNSYYHVIVQVTDASNKGFSKTTGLYVNPIELDYTGQFTESIARAGKALEFEVNMKRISGFSQPLVGEMAVTSARLNYQEIKTVTLQPMGDNRFLYTIPVDIEASAGFYGVEIQFNLNVVSLADITKIVA